MPKFSVFLFLVLILAGCAASVAPSPTPNPTAAPDAERGQQIFTRGFNGSPPCSTCHLASNVNFGFSLGPNLVGIAQRAGSRVEGLDATGYLHQSILEPRSYVVAGYRDIMYPDYNKFFEEQDITDLVAYLMTL